MMTEDERATLIGLIREIINVQDSITHENESTGRRQEMEVLMLIAERNEIQRRIVSFCDARIW